MKALVVFFMLCGTLYAADTTNSVSAVTTNGNASVSVKPNDDSVALAETNGFGVQFFLVEGEKFFADWEKPEPPHFTPVSIAKRGVPICTAVIFAGAGLRKNGKADVTFDVVIRKPDGSVYGKDKDMIGAQDKIDPAPRALQLARDYMGIRIEPKDPAGTYIAEVVVKDNVKKVELRLERRFTVEK
jgi:hypothetical protein